MNYNIVWRKFKWQKIGRFWLYYYHPATGDWRHTNITKFWSTYKQVLERKGWNEGFRAGVNGK
jgi:hypothetical protein